MAYTDLSFLPAAQALLGCLAAAAADLTDPPNVIGLRYGQEVVFDLAQNADLCCEGFAWVRMGSATPGYGDDETSASARCNVMTWGLELEMGIVRCAPMGTDEEIVSEVEHAATAVALAEDFMALRKAICCFGDLVPGYEFTVGTWSPAGPLGGCVGSSITLTVQIIANDEFPI